MSGKTFSSGIAKLDAYVSGFSPGEFLSIVTAEPSAQDRIARPFIEECAERKIPRVYLSVTPHKAITSQRRGKEYRYVLPSGKRAFSAFMNGANRFLRANAKGSLIIVDDLSLWKAAAGSEKNIVSLVSMIAGNAAKLQSLVFMTVAKSGLSLGLLARVKDLSDISLEMVEQRGEIIFLPLTLKRRYAPLGTLPLRMKNLSRQLSSGQSLSGAEPASLDAGAEAPSMFLDERYKEVLHSAADGIVLFTLRGGYREFNDRAVGLLGVGRDEAMRKNVTEFVDPSERIRLLRVLIELRRKKSAVRTFTIPRDGKHTVPVECHFSSLGGDYCLAIIHDITERVRMETEAKRREEDFVALIERHPDAVAVATQNTIVYANARFSALFGFGEEGVAPATPLKGCFTAESWKKTSKMMGQSAPSDGVRTEVWCVRKDGSTFIAGAGIAEISFRGKRCAMLSFTDTTIQKKLIDALSASEARYRSIVNESPSPLALIRDGKIELANDAAARMFELESPDALKGWEVSRLADDASKPNLEKFFSKEGALRKGKGVTTFTAVRPGGLPIDVELGAVVSEVSGSVIAALRDISEGAGAEKEVRRRRGEIAVIRKINDVVSLALDRTTLAKVCTDTLMSALGWDVGAMYRTKPASKTLSLVYDRHASEVFKEKLGTLELEEGLGGFLAKTREPLFMNMRKYPSHIPNRKIFQALGLQSVLLIPLISREAFAGLIILGAKEEKPADAYSEELLAGIATSVGTAAANADLFSEVDRLVREQQGLIDSIPQVLYISAPNGQVQYISKEIATITGYAEKDFKRDPLLWLKLVHPEEKQFLLERTLHLAQLRQRRRVEYRILPRGKASYRLIRDEYSAVLDAGGNIVAVQGALTDVTDEKAHYDELLTMYSMDRNVIAGMPEGVLVVDKDLKCIHWNAALERMTGKKGEEVLGRSPASVFPHMEQHRIDQFLTLALAGEEIKSDDVRYYKPESSNIGYLSGSFGPIRDANGTIVCVVGILGDVTGRKQLEMEMRDSEQVLRNVIDTMGDILLIADLKGNVLEVNKSFLRVLGYSRSETIGHEFPYRWVLEEEMGRFVLWIAELRERNWLHDFDMTWRAKDGKLIPMSLSTTLLRNSMGEPIATLNIARDITERKRLTKDLESRTRQIEMINRIISKANETMDFDEIFHSIAAEINEVIASDLINIGILTEDEASLTVYPLKGAQALHKGDTLPVERTLSRVAIASGKPVVVPDLTSGDEYRNLSLFSKGIRSQISFPIVLKGKAFGALNIASQTPNFYSDADAHLLQPIAQQIGTIIDRVQLFRQVTEDSAYIHNLLDSIGSIVYTVDTQFRIREVNKAWHEFMQDSGVPGIRNYQGMNLFDVLPSETLKDIFRPIVGDIVAGGVRVYSREFVHPTVTGDRIYQLTVNPMTIDRKITGLVFTHSDITALKNTERELKRSNEQLLALNKISTLISTSLDLSEILDATIPLLRRETESDAVLVYLLDRATQELTLAKESGFENAKGGKASQGIVRKSRVTGSVVLTKEPVYISEKASLDERVYPEKREILRMTGYQAMAVIPLASKNQVWGALDIFFESSHDFSPQERQMLSLVGNQLGTAMENAQLYQELRSQVSRLTVLYEISQHLTSTLEIQEIFSAVHESIRHVVPYETITISLYDASTNSTSAVFHSSAGSHASAVDAVPRDAKSIAPDSAAAIVVETKRSHRDAGDGAMDVPMLSKETIIGILSVRGLPGTPFTETHLRLLESVGNLTALAMEKAKLYEETVKISLEIQRRNKELDDFTYVVSHDLKEPLISIEGFSRILQADYHDVVQAEGKDYLESIVGATTRMKGLIDDLLMLSRVSRPSEAFKPVMLAKVVEDIKTDMEFTIRQKGVTFVIPTPLPAVYGNEIQLQIVFRNLIGNAVKFNDKQRPVVEIGFQNSDNNMYLFHVRDNGIGIAKDFFEKVFVIFQRLHRREEYEGTGAGLAIVKKIIETHKGRIWIESEVGSGSTFFFTIPKGSPHDG